MLVQRADHHKGGFIVDAADHGRAFFQRQQFFNGLVDDVHYDVHLILLRGKDVPVPDVDIASYDIVVIQRDRMTDKRVAVTEKPLLFRFQHIVVNKVKSDAAVPHADQLRHQFALARFVVRGNKRPFDPGEFPVEEQDRNAADVVFAQNVDVGIHGAGVNDQAFRVRSEQLF